MPRPANLPDLSDVDITELKLMILAVLEGDAFYWRRSIVCTMFAVYGLPPPVT
jgi:hypothetical protein